LPGEGLRRLGEGRNHVHLFEVLREPCGSRETRSDTFVEEGSGGRKGDWVTTVFGMSRRRARKRGKDILLSWTAHS